MYLYFLLLFLSVITFPSILLLPVEGNDLESIKNNWINAGNEFATISWPLKDSFVTFLRGRLEQLEKNAIGSKCHHGLQYFAESLETNQLWSLQSKCQKFVENFLKLFEDLLKMFSKDSTKILIFT